EARQAVRQAALQLILSEQFVRPRCLLIFENICQTPTIFGQRLLQADDGLYCCLQLFHFLACPAQHDTQLLAGRRPPMLSPEAFHRSPEFVFPLANVIGKTDCTVLLSNGTTNGLAHPPVRVRYKLKPTAWLKFFEGSHQTNIALLNEVEKWYPPASITV